MAARGALGRSSTERIHGSDYLPPSADPSLLTGSAEDALFPMCRQVETALWFVGRGDVSAGLIEAQYRSFCVTNDW